MDPWWNDLDVTWQRLLHFHSMGHLLHLVVKTSSVIVAISWTSPSTESHIFGSHTNLSVYVPLSDILDTRLPGLPLPGDWLLSIFISAHNLVLTSSKIIVSPRKWAFRFTDHNSTYQKDFHPPLSFRTALMWHWYSSSSFPVNANTEHLFPRKRGLDESPSLFLLSCLLTRHLICI